MLARLRHCADINLLLEVYFALVYSHLSYCNIIWGKASKTVLKPLNRAHEKIAKIMTFAPYGTEETIPLFLNLNILNLSQINKLEKAKFIFKHQNNKLPPSFDNYFRNTREIQSRNSRRIADGNIYSTFGRTCYGQKMIQNEGASIWNNIPLSIRNVNKLDTFSSNYKKFLLLAG